MARTSLFTLGVALLVTHVLGDCVAAHGSQSPCHAQWPGQGHAQVCPPNAAYLVDPKTSKGACCPPVGHKYFWDERSQTGSCCPDTTVGFDGYMCVDPQYQPQYGGPQNCGGCSGGGQAPIGNSNVNNNQNTNDNNNPSYPGNNNNHNANNPNPSPGYNEITNNNYNANNLGSQNPPGPGNNQNSNTNMNNNYNYNSPGQGNTAGPGSDQNINTNNNYNANPNGAGPGSNQNTNTNNNYNANPNGAGPGSNQNTNTNNNYNPNPNGPGKPNGPSNQNSPGNPNGSGNCVNCCGGSKTNGTGGACDPSQLSNGCTERICPDVKGDKVGLRYGHCYRFKNPEGQALNKRDHGLQDYVWGGYYAHIYQFRICRSTSDCSKGDEVSVNEPFVINDQMGRTSKSGPDTLFWVVELPLWHFGNSDSASSAVKFTARPWVGDSCGICLKGEGKGIGPVCPATNPGIGFKDNPRYCVPIILEKVPCLQGDGNLERPGQPEQFGRNAVGHDEL